MKQDQFAAAIDKLGLSQLGAGRLLRMEGRQVRRIIAGEAEVPYPVAVLLRLLLRGKIRPADIETAAEAMPPLDAPFGIAVVLSLALKGKITVRDIVNASRNHH